jgi:hypothetical protein
MAIEFGKPAVCIFTHPLYQPNMLLVGSLHDHVINYKVNCFPCDKFITLTIHYRLTLM